MTKAKKWPENAEWARVDAIATLERSTRELSKIIDLDIPDEAIRRIGKLINELHITKEKLKDCKTP